MKRLDQIIKEHVDRGILEQATADWKKYTKLKPTAANTDKYTKNTIKFGDTAFSPWPTSIAKPTPWPNINMEKFLKNRLIYTYCKCTWNSPFGCQVLFTLINMTSLFKSPTMHTCAKI